jgi:transglutaminase-like putative cysteine protease
MTGRTAGRQQGAAHEARDADIKGEFHRLCRKSGFDAERRLGYEYAKSTRTAFQAYQERIGVCRDFAHLAITLCRCLNIPARYCNGYLGDIGVPPDPAPMDFNAWFEVYLGSGLSEDGSQEGRWFTFDARHNIPRIGRIVVARGRDANDIPMLNSFGPHTLQHFTVLTEEV